MADLFGSVIDAALAGPREERAVAGEELWLIHPGLAGGQVGYRAALGLAALFAGVNVLSTDVACLPLSVYQRMPDGSRREARDDPRADLLKVSPDGVSTSMRWRQAWMGHALLWKGGYAEIVRTGRGMPAKLHLLDPTVTRAQWKAGRLIYATDSGRDLPADDVLHLAGLGFDGINGYDLLTYANDVLGLGLDLQEFARGYFGNGAFPSGVLQTPRALNDQARKNLRASFEDKHMGTRKAGRVALLEEGVTWQQANVSPEASQHLETRKFMVIEVARLLRVPPNKLMDFSQAHLSNVEASNIDYLTTSLMPWLEAIEQELNFKLFTAAERRAGFYVEHNMAAFLRGDMAARAEFYTKLRDLGVLTPNMIGARENLDPIGPAGDVRLVPLNMVNLEVAGKVDEPVAAPTPTAPTSAPADDGEADNVDDQVEPVIDSTGPLEDMAERAEEPGDWLDGNQMFSVKRVVNDVALGELPAASSLAMLKLMLPGIPDDQLNAIYGPLDGFVAASVKVSG
jgi:HK97 family phage portal protein